MLTPGKKESPTCEETIVFTQKRFTPAFPWKQVGVAAGLIILLALGVVVGKAYHPSLQDDAPAENVVVADTAA